MSRNLNRKITDEQNYTKLINIRKQNCNNHITGYIHFSFRSNSSCMLNTCRKWSLVHQLIWFVSVCSRLHYFCSWQGSCTRFELCLRSSKFLRHPSHRRLLFVQASICFQISIQHGIRMDMSCRRSGNRRESSRLVGCWHMRDKRALSLNSFRCFTFKLLISLL